MLKKFWYGVTLVLLLSLCVGVYAKVYKQYRATRIYNTLNQVTHLNAKLIIVKSDELNAWTDFKNIYVTTTMLRVANDDNELAFVIGHEISHVYYHTGDEKKADIGSIHLLQQQGTYDACKGGIGIFNKFLQHDGEGGGPGDPHPKNSTRLQYTQQLAC